jgi:hypothetical protein
MFTDYSCGSRTIKGTHAHRISVSRRTIATPYDQTIFILVTDRHGRTDHCWVRLCHTGVECLVWSKYGSSECNDTTDRGRACVTGQPEHRIGQHGCQSCVKRELSSIPHRSLAHITTTSGGRYDTGCMPCVSGSTQCRCLVYSDICNQREYGPYLVPYCWRRSLA